MPLPRHKQKPRPKPKPKPAQPTGPETTAESIMAPYSLAGASLDSLLHTMKLLRLDSQPADEFLPLPERRDRAQENVERDYDSSQRLTRLFPGLTRDTPTLTFADLDVWPEWSKHHLTDFKPPFTSGMPSTKEFDHLRSEKGLGKKSIGGAFTRAVSIGDKLANDALHGADGDDWLETRKALLNLAFCTDAFGPIVKVCEQRLVIEVVDVRKVTPMESGKPSIVPERLEPVPIIVVRFAMPMSVAPPTSAAEQLAMAPLLRHLGLLPQRVPTLQYNSNPSETLNILSLLLHNSALLSPDYVQAMKQTLSDDVKHLFGVFFVVPLHSVDYKVSSKIASADAFGGHCALPACDKSGAKMICSRCKSVYYCDAAHATEDWSTHKLSCLRKKNPDIFLRRAADRGRILVPLASKTPNFYSVINWQTGKPTTINTGIIPKNIHGSHSFLIKAQRSGGGNHFAVNIYDRERTILINQESKQPISDSSAEGVAEFAPFKKLDDCILACTRWDGLKAYLRAYRVGDQIEIDLEDLPSQEQTW